MVPYLQACRGAALEGYGAIGEYGLDHHSPPVLPAPGESWANMIVSQHDRPTVQLVSVCPAGPGSRNRLDGRPDCPLRIQPVVAPRLWGVLDVVIAVVDFGHRVDFGCWARTAATSLRPNPYRGAALHRAVRSAARRHGRPAEGPVAVPGDRLRLSPRAFSGRRHSFGIGLITVQSRLRRGNLEVLASTTRSRTWVMETRFVMRCAATASLR